MGQYGSLPGQNAFEDSLGHLWGLPLVQGIHPPHHSRQGSHLCHCRSCQVSQRQPGGCLSRFLVLPKTQVLCQGAC